MVRPNRAAHRQLPSTRRQSRPEDNQYHPTPVRLARSRNNCQRAHSSPAPRDAAMDTDASPTRVTAFTLLHILRRLAAMYLLEQGQPSRRHAFESPRNKECVDKIKADKNWHAAFFISSNNRPGTTCGTNRSEIVSHVPLTRKHNFHRSSSLTTLAFLSTSQ